MRRRLGPALTTQTQTTGQTSRRPHSHPHRRGFARAQRHRGARAEVQTREGALHHILRGPSFKGVGLNRLLFWTNAWAPRTAPVQSVGPRRCISVLYQRLSQLLASSTKKHWHIRAVLHFLALRHAASLVRDSTAVDIAAAASPQGSAARIAMNETPAVALCNHAIAQSTSLQIKLWWRVHINI